MSKWLLRGVVFAALMVIVRLLQGAMIGAWEQQSLLISITLVVLYIAVAFAWGIVDGQSDAKAQSDPDRREDLALAWLLAGLFAGVVSGLVSWIIGQLYDNIYVDALLAELTTFAAFTALIVFVAGVCGVSLGRWLIDRKAPPPPKHDHAGAGDRADTDVFAAVTANQAAAAGDAEADAEAEATKP
ncbi:MAG: B-4DMT family transporter [Mycobacterium sp.]|nr:B-4DMT family transporter [Mycobacterium sp.]